MTATSHKWVFISYRRGDTGLYARLLHETLARELGSERVFLDRDDIEPGTDFTKRIENTLGAAAVVFALIGVTWLRTLRERSGSAPGTPDYVLEELIAAKRNGVAIVPVLVDGSRMPAAAELPERLRFIVKCQAMELSERFYGGQVGEVVRVAKQHLGLASPAAIGSSGERLLEAARAGSTRRIRVLLREGVDVETRDADGGTALMLAAGHSHANAVRALMKHGANVNAVADNGVTPLIFAVFQGAHPIITKILLEAGSEVDARTDDGTTALLFAAHRCDRDVVRLLLDHGADPRATNDAGAFPMTRALACEDTDEDTKIEVMKMLLEAAQRRYGPE